MSLARHSSPIRSTHACFLSLTSLRIERRVVQQDLDAVGAGFLQPADGPVVEQIRQPAGPGLVVAGLLVGQQQARRSSRALADAGRPHSGSSRIALACRRQHFGDERS